MKRILICVEAVAYDYIVENDIKPLADMDIHPAVAFGLGSRPSAAALMGGMLPVCQIPRCHHRRLREVWNSPWFLTTMKCVTEKQFYLVANGWIIEILLPWMTQKQINLNFKWHDEHEKCPTTEIVDYFLKESKNLNSYFAYLHMFESHFPFYSPEGTGNRIRSLEFVGQQVQRVLDERPNDEIIIVSDHNIPPLIESAANDVPAPMTMLSFIGCNEQAKKGKLWKEMELSPVEIAKYHWKVGY